MAFQGDSIFWVDTAKVVPNPFQPRREFDQSKLQELSESIRMYGVLQPLTVTRKEVQQDDGTFYTEYELIAGERRLRASKLAQVAQVPVIIREGEQSEQEKLELAIIENLQREDLNAIDRALAFQQLAEQFELSHTEVAKKVQRSREYVSNSIRLLALPEHMQSALQRGELGEGHARTLLMLTDRPEEQETIFREILLKKMSVREVERIVRKIATDKVRKKQHTDIDDHLIEIEKEFTETLGTRVQILKTEFGGKLTIDYFSEDDLSAILKRMQAEAVHTNPAAAQDAVTAMVAATPLVSSESDSVPAAVNTVVQNDTQTPVPTAIESLRESHNQPEQPNQFGVTSVSQERGDVSEAPTHNETPVEPNEHTATPAADPSLLERLSAFRQSPSHVESQAETRPDTQEQTQTVVEHERATVVPDPIPVSSHSPEPVYGMDEPFVHSAPAPEVVTNTAHTTPETNQQTQQTTESQKFDEDEDLYSVRNFSV